jgi:hypothetical protein
MTIVENIIENFKTMINIEECFNSFNVIYSHFIYLLHPSISHDMFWVHYVEATTVAHKIIVE